jgi:hypothetical protein
MINLKLRDSTLFANRVKIVNLNRPFKSIVSYSAEKDKHLSSRLVTSEEERQPLLPYHVQITETKAGVLYGARKNTFKVYWVYSTNSRVSSTFRDVVLQEFFKEMHNDEDMRRYIVVIISLLVNSFDFEYIFTDIPGLEKIYKKVPIVFDPTKLLNISPERVTTPTIHVVKSMLREHTEGLPLRLFDSQVYTAVSLFKNTTFDKSILPSEKGLILMGTNHYYAGFLAKELNTYSLNEKVLPVCLFYIGEKE